jgi:hypothetical protein
VNVTVGMLLRLRLITMELRAHPLMSFRGRPNWPPEWIQTPTKTTDTEIGEAGTLEEVYRSVLDPSRCYLTMTHNEQTYLGVLRFDSTEFCKQMSELLLRNIRRPIAEVAGLDISL